MGPQFVQSTLLPKQLNQLQLTVHLKILQTGLYIGKLFISLYTPYCHVIHKYYPRDKLTNVTLQCN